MSIDPLTAAANLVDVWSVYRPMEDDELFGRLSYGEVEPLADIFRAMNANELADQIIEAHAGTRRRSRRQAPRHLPSAPRRGAVDMTVRDMMLSIDTMNAGTPDEHERVFVRCHMGHELYSLALKNLRRYPAEFDQCTHYAHKTED